MLRILSDNEIAQILAESKPLPKNWKKRLEPLPKSKMGHFQRNFEFDGKQGRHYQIFTRKNDNLIDDFSIGLQLLESPGDKYTIVRLNGIGHKHTNKWERKNGDFPYEFKNQFHIHMATERYQNDGLRIEGYAEVTTDFFSFDSALDYFVRSFGFEVEGGMQPQNSQLKFDGFET